ncbi:MAG: ABC transporter permease, partial [Bradyrhizobium sp.]
MAQFILRRTIYSLITLFILSLTIFTVVRLTGDPVTFLAEPGMSRADLQQIREEWGLDRPLPVQYLAFVKNVFTGELGNSFNYEMPVSTLYFQRLPNSLELGLAATLISLLIGIPAGLISAVRVNSGWDNAGKVIALFGLAIPGFW